MVKEYYWNGQYRRLLERRATRNRVLLGGKKARRYDRRRLRAAKFDQQES